ncbi:MAG: NAD-dependent deacylase [Candidatus Accumulibacter sp.]|jgi:NAD-dependent deacetylase|nr:NAD-dependent deacylase [Accumulibacter sp.]
MTDNHNTDALPPKLHAILARPFKRIVVFSGAGMSADSGIPTFRSGENGLWNAYNPSDLATPDAWRRDKETVWAWYEWRRGIVMAAQPHPGHVAVAELQRRRDAKIITQNVDDLHERAGATDVLHLHGSLFAARCSACGKPCALGEPPQEQQRQITPPRCQKCQGYIRPGVVWFGENLDTTTVKQARHAIADCDLLLIVGTSGVVYPAAGMVDEAPSSATIVEINPQPYETSSRIAFQWRTTAARGLPEVAGSILAKF